MRPIIPNGRQYLNRTLDTVGNGSGTKNAIGDYSGGGLETFFIAPPATQTFLITRFLPQVVDAGSFDAASWGNGITLANGVKVAVVRGSTDEIDLTDANTLKTNADWGRVCFDVFVSTWGVGNEYLHARWSFFKGGVPGLYLHGAHSDKLVVTLNDDMSDLVAQYFAVQGHVLELDQHGVIIK